jgi:hypothetical protein
MIKLRTMVIAMILLLSLLVANAHKTEIRGWLKKQSRAATMIIFKQHLINMEEKFGQNGAVTT